jgi:hypothetical protein
VIIPKKDAPWCGREETPFAFLVPPSRCELLLVQIAFGFLEKIRGWAARDLSPQSQRRRGWSRSMSIDTAPDAGQGDTLLPILAPMGKLTHSF